MVVLIIEMMIMRDKMKLYKSKELILGILLVSAMADALLAREPVSSPYSSLSLSTSNATDESLTDESSMELSSEDAVFPLSIIPVGVTIEDEAEIHMLLKSGDSRAWEIVRQLNAFHKFPYLLDQIQCYAQDGHPKAQQFLGKLYETGVGVYQSTEMANFYYNMAASQE